MFEMAIKVSLNLDSSPQFSFGKSLSDQWKDTI